MDDILNELFLGNYSPRDPHPAPGEITELEARAIAALGPDGFDELVSTLFAHVREEDANCFRSGFRLGARLILEVLRS